jgi:hypothetical protein
MKKLTNANLAKFHMENTVKIAIKLNVHPVKQDFS